MALHELPGTINYLTDAAHLLRMTCPHTSAHLMSQRTSLLSQHGISLSDTQRQHVCGACGHIMIPGNQTSLKLETRRAIRAKGAAKARIGASRCTPSTNFSSKLEAPRNKVLTCGSCGRDTTISLERPGPASRRNPVTKPVQKKATSPAVAEPPKASANASSKKRAKNRKAGLQALLSSQPQQSTNPLSLAHFMNK